MNIKIPCGDYGVAQTFNIQDSDGLAKDLTSYTVMFKMWVPGYPGTLLINSACVVTDAVNGVCTYTSIAGDFNTVGVYNAEIELTATGKVDSSMQFTVSVLESG